MSPAVSASLIQATLISTRVSEWLGHPKCGVDRSSRGSGCMTSCVSADGPSGGSPGLRGPISRWEACACHQERPASPALGLLCSGVLQALLPERWKVDSTGARKTRASEWEGPEVMGPRFLPVYSPRGLLYEAKQRPLLPKSEGGPPLLAFLPLPNSSLAPGDSARVLG